MMPATETPQDAWPRLRAQGGSDTTVLLATTTMSHRQTDRQSIANVYYRVVQNAVPPHRRTRRGQAASGAAVPLIRAKPLFFGQKLTFWGQKNISQKFKKIFFGIY